MMMKDLIFAQTTNQAYIVFLIIIFRNCRSKVIQFDDAIQSSTLDFLEIKVNLPCLLWRPCHAVFIKKISLQII